tara:strand:- start:2054 stop:2656 length:603 start_codon:yes stop_codon:yes gene_type:complete
MDRKKKIKFYQFVFFISGLLIILFTYLKESDLNKEKIISENVQKKIDEKLQNNNNENNIFYNVKYSGLDLEGNRYIIRAEEAINSDTDINIVRMKAVNAVFYFKDNTTLNISSKEGSYNNKTLDMEFSRNIIALYEGSELYAEKAIFSNSKNSLIVSDKVKVIDPSGSLIADRLKFSIKDKTLNISSLKNNMIKSEINYK